MSYGKDRRVIRKHQIERERQNKIRKITFDLLIPKWTSAPDGTKCSNCSSNQVERSYVTIGGPFSGTIRCLNCKYSETVMSYIGKNMIKIEPLVIKQ
jgi:hypothetical protein